MGNKIEKMNGRLFPAHDPYFWDNVAGLSEMSLWNNPCASIKVNYNTPTAIAARKAINECDENLFYSCGVGRNNGGPSAKDWAHFYYHAKNCTKR